MCILSAFDRIDELMRAGQFDDAVSEAQSARLEYGPDLAKHLSTKGIQAPGVLIVGPARTASTWLRGVLGKHPRITVANGEPNLLLRLDAGGIRDALSWYSQPSNWRTYSKPNAIYCDKSPSYFAMSSRSMRILSILFPYMKIIIGQRDEPDRLWSAINHRMKDFQYTKGWMTFCKDYPNEVSHHLDSTRFSFHTDRWKTAFSSENIIIIPFSSVHFTPKDCVNRALRHVNLHTIDELPVSNRRGLEARLAAAEKKSDIGTPPDNLIEIARRLVTEKI